MKLCVDCKWHRGSKSGNPKAGPGIPIYGHPWCITCLRAAEQAEAEARGEKYERWYCEFGWYLRVGGSSCVGTNWEWTRAQIVEAVTGEDGYEWDWVRVNGPGLSLTFTRWSMPGETWGEVVASPISIGRVIQTFATWLGRL